MHVFPFGISFSLVSLCSNGPRGWLKRQPNRKWVMCAAPHLGTVIEAQSALWGFLDRARALVPPQPRDGDGVSKANGSLMWCGTKANIWKTPMYLNRPKWIFCSNCQAGLSVTLACLEEERKSFLQGLIHIEKIMLCFDFSSLSSEGFIARSSFFTACLNSTCPSRADVNLILRQYTRWLKSSAASPPKTWFHS